MTKAIAATKQILMSDMFSENETIGVRRLKVATLSRQEQQIARGEFFVGSSTRTGVLADGAPFYSVIESGDKFLIIEDVIQTSDFSSITDGHFSHSMDVFVDGSITSSFTYTPLGPLPMGRSMNADNINDFPAAKIDLGVVATPTGEPEYPLFYTDFYIDTGGNRNTIGQSSTDFFSKGRQIIIPPNSKSLVRSVSSGGATGDATIRTIFFFSEIAVEEAQTLLGITV